MRGHVLSDDSHRAGSPALTALAKRFGHVVALVFLAAVCWLVIDRARKVDWHAVWLALLAYPLSTLAVALALATTAHMLFASYDLLARRYVGHKVRPLKVLGVGLVVYAVNLNLGSLIGGIGFRWRLYSKLGLDALQIGRIFGFSVTTNWSGYFVLAGVLLATRSFEPPPELGIPGELLQLLGIALLTVAALYLVACFTARKRSIELRGHHFVLPTGDIAWRQLALSMLHWSVTGALIYTLMPPGPDYPTVLGTLMCAAVAGTIVRVPGGLGVVEAVFVATLGDRVPEGALIAALLAYRAAFYLLPLAGATAMHFTLEALARRHSARRTQR
jgi:uncharacterized membrane protein YbhN (UPF0104 family)